LDVTSNEKMGSVSRVDQVPLDKISVINPRAQNRKVLEGIVKNISQIGLSALWPVSISSVGRGNLAFKCETSV
jgi:hypothetical protein